MPETGLASLGELPLGELRGRQLTRLRRSLRHVYANVPFYRDRLETLGMVPDDVKDLADLAGLPLTAKNDLRDTYPFGLLAVPRDQLRRVHASSGTTGTPTVVA